VIAASFVRRAKYAYGPRTRVMQHIRFDEDPEQGQGALSRHLVPNDAILPLWQECKRIFVEAAPVLQT